MATGAIECNNPRMDTTLSRSLRSLRALASGDFPAPKGGGPRKSLRVLIVEDSEDDAGRLLRCLREGGYEPVWERVETAEAMRAALDKANWDVILSDYSMPEFSGWLALRLLKETGLDLPFILVTGTISEGLAVQAMKAGAGDYLMKDNLARLCASIQREIKEAKERRRRRKAEGNRKLAVAILKILNRPDESKKLIGDLVKLLKEEGGFDAVRLRLKKGEDYPHFVQEGFPDSFLAEDDALVAKDAAGETVRDAAGAPFLKCICGLVIRGRADADLPCFTKGGSFWTNSMTDTFASLEGTDFEKTARKCCLKAGFESLALIPLPSGDGIAGLLQLAARGRGRFDPDDIDFFEDMALSIGVALRRKQAEDALRESERKSHAVFDQAFALIGLMTPDGTLLDINRAALELAGIRLSDAAGKLFWKTPWWTHSQEMQDQLRAAVASAAKGNLVRFEATHPAFDGSLHFVDFSLKPVKDEGGNVVFLVPEGRDITEQKRTQAELAELENQFRHSQKMEAVGRLAGGVAHDFNNILTAILGYCRLLEGGMEHSDPRLDDVGEISRAAERAAALTKELLAFSRRQVMTPKVISLNTCIRDTEKMLRRLIREDIELTLSLEPDIKMVKSDPGQLEQVVMNLVVNSRDAMPNMGKLTIETRNVVLSEEAESRHDVIPPGSYAVLSISDTGCGMSAEVKAHIFEPYFTTKERGKGTGLGLSTVYGIIKQSGGYIWIYSEEGRGTTFKLFLPSTDEAEDQHSARPLASSEVRGSETILLVEDEDSVRNLIARILRKNGYKVLEARAGAEAMEIVVHRKRRIDLALTDMVMPGMGGKALADRLKALRPRMPIIFMSGYSDEAVMSQGEIEAGSLFITKPITYDLLLKMLRQALDSPVPAN